LLLQGFERDWFVSSAIHGAGGYTTGAKTKTEQLRNKIDGLLRLGR
jgi:hypothetical protein